MDDEAVGSGAGLTHVPQLSEHCPCDGGVQVRVLEDNERGVPAEFHGGPQYGFRRVGQQPAAHFGGAGEGELPEALVLDQRSGGGTGRGGGDEVQDARGQPGLLHHGGEQLGGQRGEVRGLQDHGAAGGHRGCDLAGGHGQREVPRRDQQAGAYRLLGDQQSGLAVRGYGVAAKGADGFLGEPAEELGTIGDFATGFGQRLAHLHGHQEREVFGAFGHQFKGTAQDLATFTRRDLCPGLLGSGGCVQGRGTVLSAGIGDAEQDLPGGRILDVERLARSGVAPLTVDQQSGRNRGKKPAFAVRGNGWLCSDSHDDSLVSRVVAALRRGRSDRAHQAD